MITAIFNPDTTMANAYGLWQWDYGQVLRIQGLHLPSMVEIHFSLQETGGTSASRVGVTKDGVTDVIIPDSMLENDGATKDYDMFAFVYLTDATSGQTEYKINLQVESRPKPEVFGGGENPMQPCQNRLPRPQRPTPRPHRQERRSRKETRNWQNREPKHLNRQWRKQNNLLPRWGRRS